MNTKKSFLTNYKTLLPFILIVLLSGSAWMLGLHRYLNLEALKTHQQAVELFISHYQAGSVFLFIIIYSGVVALSIPGAAFMSLAGGFLFGQTLGTCAVVVAATAGATLLFLTTRLASQDLIRRKASRWMEKMKPDFRKMLLPTF